MRFAEKSTLVRILVWTSLFATLIVTPWFSYDPINVPKLAVLALGAFLGAGVLASNFRREWLVTYRSQLIVCALFILDLIFVLIFSGNNFNILKAETDFPEPLSPTIANVLPFSIEKEIS